LIVVASLVVHCCAIKKEVIVASQFHNVADVQFTVEYKAARLFFWGQISNFWPFFNCFDFFNCWKKAKWNLAFL